MEPIHTIYTKDKQKRMQIFYDESAGNPRTEFDNATKFAFSHRKYDLPNEGDVPFESLNFDSDKIEAWLRENADAYMIRLVSMHDHSGVSFYLGKPHEPWDSGIVGFIYITKKDAIANKWANKRGVSTRKQRLAMLGAMEADLKTYTQWSNGQVFGYVVTEKCKNCDTYTENRDSCWGFYDLESIGIENPEFKEQIENI